MKVSLFFLTILFAVQVPAQAPDAILATAAGKNFTAASLSVEGQNLYAKQKQLAADFRSQQLEQMTAEMLLEDEAKTRSVKPEALLAPVHTKVAEPTAKEIQSIYDLNRADLGGRTLEETRPEIIQFLKRAASQKAIDDYIGALREKYKVTTVKDVNAAGLKPFETLVTIGSESITVQEFETKNAAQLNDREFDIYLNLRADLEASMMSVLVAEEAKALSIDASSVLATEVTDKMRAYTDEERVGLEDALKKKLFAKYNAKILLKQPPDYIQKISVDDDPATGPLDAPVTVVMFSDFQCSACSATHPILKRTIAEFPGKVRFVVRDYPLTELHDHAFRAALAANAARAQGKFFEYIDILYANQNALDDASLKKYAARLGLNLKQFELDLNGEKLAAEVRKDMADGLSYGVSWTPTIYINGVKLHRSGAEDLRGAINKALQK